MPVLPSGNRWIRTQSALNRAGRHFRYGQPDRTVETLIDSRMCARHAMDSVAEAWRIRRESRYLPELQPAVRDIIVGRVLALADTVVAGRASV